MTSSIYALNTKNKPLFFKRCYIVSATNKSYITRDKNRELEIKLKKVYVDNALLAQELERIQNDPVYQERIAREKMGVVRKGEIPIKIVPDQKRK